jgi:hypothetical protein
MPTHRWMMQRSCYALAGKQFCAGGRYDVTGVYVVAMTRAAILSQATVREQAAVISHPSPRKRNKHLSSESPTRQQEALFAGPIGEL